jgi:hypothetical protein
VTRVRLTNITSPEDGIVDADLETLPVEPPPPPPIDPPPPPPPVDPPPPPSPERQAEWIEIDFNLFAFRPVGDWYPDSTGVLIRLDGAISTDTSSRPNGFDATGPNENSEYHWYESGYYTHKPGDIFEAEGTDTDGESFHFAFVVEGTVDPPPPVDPPDPVDPPPPVDPPDPVDPPPPVDPPDPVDPPPPVDPPSGDLPAFAHFHTDPTRRDDEWFIGCRLPESELVHVSTLIVNESKLYEGIRADRILITSGGKNATVRDCWFEGNSNYTADFTNGWTFGGFANSEDFAFEHCTLNNGTTGKTILGSGYTLDYCHVIGGEDTLHRNQPGKTKIYRSILEEQNIDSQSHSDAIQNTSGGAVGPVNVIESILQGNVAGACFQNNISNGTNTALRTYMSGGGHYIVNGDKGNLITTDCYFGWESTFHPWGDPNRVPASIGTHNGARWWSRLTRPRQFGFGGNHHPTNEAANFPGNGTPI